MTTVPLLSSQKLHSTQRQNAQKSLEAALAQVLEGDLGYSASHPGLAPHEWLGPPGSTDLGYAGLAAHVSDSMLEKGDVLKPAELQKFKFHREDHLYCCKVNTINHCFIRACSDYCWREESLTQPYDKNLHYNEDTASNKPEVTQVFDQKNKNTGEIKKMARIRVHACRMGFGYQLGPRHGRYKDRTALQRKFLVVWFYFSDPLEEN